MYVICNNTLLNDEELVLPVQNRAFLFNDGFFETLVMKNGKICFWEDHLIRMEQAMKTLHLHLPEEFTSEEMYRQLTGLASVNGVTEAARFRIRVWRDGDGLYMPEPDAGTCYLMTVQPFEQNNSVVESCSFCSRTRNHFSPLSGFKGPQTTHYILASLEKREKNTAEIILSNQDGYISEALASNLFWLKNERLFTPSLETGCVAGVMRKNVLVQWQEAGYELEEGFFKMEELLTADAIFISNVTGIRPVASILDNPFTEQHPLVNWLQQKLT